MDSVKNIFNNLAIISLSKLVVDLSLYLLCSYLMVKMLNTFSYRSMSSLNKMMSKALKSFNFTNHNVEEFDMAQLFIQQSLDKLKEVGQIRNINSTLILEMWLIKVLPSVLFF